MHSLTSVSSAVIAAFLASSVEFVEAFTIILAVGLAQGWRPAWIGTASAVVALAVMVLVLGPLLTLIPVGLLQYVVGSLLVLFGIRWLRKAILRAAGFIALRDEAKAFAAETDALRRQAADRRADLLAGLAAFKAVLLEGLEVVFIVIAVGAGNGLTLYASLGAAAAGALVIALGLLVRRPLARVPENGLKFAVGLLLTAFGIFWIGEGLGVPWPGADLAILGILAVLTLVALVSVRIVREAQAGVVQAGRP